MESTVPEIKWSLEGLNCRLEIAEEKKMNLRIGQWKLANLKNRRRIRRASKTCGTTASTPTSMSWESHDMERKQKSFKIKKYWMKTSKFDETLLCGSKSYMDYVQDNYRDPYLHTSY